MMHTVRFALVSLNLNEYSHVSIRRRLQHGFDYLGGGSVGSVLSRFDDLEILDSFIIDDILVIYVK